MTATPTMTGQLRIERTVWSLNALLGDLPAKSRRAARRDVRANLREAAADLGAAEAVRRLGPLHRVAAGYLDAEYGEDRPRPRWSAALVWTVAVGVAVVSAGIAGNAAFAAGAVAADPHVTGTFHWYGLEYLGFVGDVTLADGRDTGAGYGTTLFFYLNLFVVYLIAGRSWRALPAWRRRTAVTADQ